MNPKSLSLKIGWLYPELMSTYGDRGNVTCMRKRCEWRDIGLEVIPINQKTSVEDLKKVDLIFGGGAQDRQQEIVMRDLKDKKNWIIEKIEADTPALFVCGSPQLMGKYYEPAEGQRIDGVGVFDMVSKHPGKGAQRCIGNIVAQVNWEYLDLNLVPSISQSPLQNQKSKIKSQNDKSKLKNNNETIKFFDNTQDKQWINAHYIVGFENHGGRTYLGEKVKPFAKVIKGYGNNGEDGTEGVVYKNAVGCYFHGPLLPKNPHIADWIIQRALEIKYKERIELKKLDDSLEWKAHDFIIDKLLNS